MLAILLFRSARTVSADDLIDAVWGEDAPPRAIGALRTYAFRLRRILEEPDAPPKILVSAGDGYTVRIPDEALDVSVFEAQVKEAEKSRANSSPLQASALLHEALGLWEGTPLASVPGPFAEAQRTRLTEFWLSALESRLELDLELRRHSEVVGELTSLTNDHPLRERLRGMLMLALYRCGRQAEALAVFADTRRTLADELGIDPGHALKQLHQRILNADPALDPPKEQGPQLAAAPVLPRPAQLPADVVDFTGRGRLVDELIGAVTREDTSAVVVSAVAGIGGVGKTALAVHVGHSIRDAFPDGQLYVDLQGVGDRPADPGMTLAGFLRALGSADSAIPDSLEERAALYRSTLADRRMLVLLDNARDTDQVRSLLPGSPTCAVLITSRARLAGLSGAQLVDLAVLDQNEALELFATIVGQDRVSAELESAIDVVARCGYLPLAVRIVAARLAARPGWTIASLADRLANERRRLTELRVGDLTVESTFRLGYDQLEPSQAQAFRFLAIPDGLHISLPAAAAILGQDEPEAEDILESLVDAAMLESPSPGIYRYHDLLRLSGRKRTEEMDSATERMAVLNRLLDFFLATARNAYRVILPGHQVTDALLETNSSGVGFSDPDAARRWASQELTGVLATITQAARSQTPPIALIADLLVGLEPLVEGGFYWRDFEPVTRLAADIAAQCGDQRSEARACAQLVCALMQMNRLDEAEQLANRVVSMSRATGDRLVRAETLTAVAYIAIRRRRYDDAIASYREGLTLQPDRNREAQNRKNSAFAHILKGKAAEAIPECQRSLAIFRELGDVRSQAHTLYTLGLAHHKLNQLGDALSRYNEGLALSRETGLRANEAYILYRLADVHLDAERFSEALACAEQSLNLSRELREEYNEGRALTALGRALGELGQPDRSQACLREAHDTFTHLGVPDAEDIRPLLVEAARASKA